MQALQNHGIDAGDVGIAGIAAARADERTRDEEGRRHADAGALRHASRRVVVGAVVGGILGAVLGAIVGALLLAAGVGGGDQPGLQLAVVILVVAALGSWLGSFLAVERGIGLDEPWELTFEDARDERSVPEGVWVAVRLRDDTTRERARRVLEHEGVPEDRRREVRLGSGRLVEW